MFSIALFWKVSITENVSVQFYTEASRGPQSFVKAILPLMLIAGLCVLFHQASSHFRAERDACVSASASPSPPFRNRERRREYRSTPLHLPRVLTIHPSIYTSVRLSESAHCRSQTVLWLSKAAGQQVKILLVRHSFTPRPFKVKVSLPVEFLLLEKHSCILKSQKIKNKK